MSCGMGLIKYLLFIFNFIFALCGLAILIVGALVLSQMNSYNTAIPDNLSFTPITVIVIGSIIFVIAFFGCCGAIRESHCMTITFASFLLTILIVQVAVAIYAFVSYKESNIDIKKTYAEVFDGYWVSSGKRQTVDIIQEGFDCCGVDSYKDFYNIQGSNNTIPNSCCSSNVEVCTPSDAFEYGCAPIIRKALIKFGHILGGVAIGIAAVELIGIIFALCLANSIKNTERRGYRV